MKKKGIQKKLVLSKETLRKLSERELKEIEGGGTSHFWNSNCDDACNSLRGCPG